MHVLIRPRLLPYVDRPRKPARSEAVAIFYEIVYSVDRAGCRGVLAISTSVRVRPPLFFSDAIVPTIYLVVFAGFVFSHFLSDFQNQYTVAKVL